MLVSIIIPFYNEKDNLDILYKELKTELKKLRLRYEIIFINDGSTDGSEKTALKLGQENQEVKVFYHRKRKGKGQALAKGMTEVNGDIVVFMDGDLQDDPKDIQFFLEKINQGYDFINGKRELRQENFLVKYYSKFGNLFTRLFMKSPFTDINCGFKAMRKEVLSKIVLYGNNFRFLPLAIFYKGFKVTEIPVNNRSRKHGKTKFGKTKLFIGLIDTLTAYFLYKFSEKPLHFFGLYGGLVFITGFLIGLYLSIERIFFNMVLYRRPILWLAILLMVVGIQIIMTGFLGELMVFISKKNQK